MAGEAAVFMNPNDGVAGMARHTEGSVSDGQRVVMSMSCRFRKICRSVAADTLSVRDDSLDLWTINRILQQRWVGVAFTALIGVHRHRVVGWMTADTERGVLDMAQAGSGVIDMEMDGRCCLVKVAVQAIDYVSRCALVGIGNDHRHGGAGGSLRIDVAVAVVTGGANPEMGGQDVWPVLGRVAVGARLIIGLAFIGERVEHDVMVNQATGAAMVMAGEVSGMTDGAFPAAGNCRAFELAIGCRAVAGGATIVGMDLACANERSGGGGMATKAYTVCRGRSKGRVHLDLIGVVVIVAIEVGGMAIGASATGAVIDRGIAVAVDANDQ